MYCGSTRVVPGPSARFLTLVLLGFLSIAGTAGTATAQARRPGPAPRTAAPPVPIDTAGSAAPASRVLLAAPAGDTLGSLAPGAAMEVIGREGEWARVRVEGWVRVEQGTELESAGPLRGLTLRELRADPERYRGQLVRWSVQFISVQRADSLRTDLRAGEQYILARDPGGEPGFLYIVVPQRLLAAARQLSPLQRLEIVGRVRTGRSALMGHPVLDLEELRP